MTDLPTTPADALRWAADRLDPEPGFRDSPPARALRRWAAELDAASTTFTLPAEPPLIGPLTPAEWCSLRLRADDDALQCCAVTSEFRDALFMLLRVGGEKYDAWLLAEAWEGMDGHGWPEGDPVIDKIREFYGPLSTVPPERGEVSDAG